MKRSPFKRKPSKWGEVSPLKKIKQQCRDLWSKLVRHRDKVCQQCGTTERLQGHHIFSVSNKNTELDIRNGITFCYKHHIWWAHSDTKDAEEFIIQWLGIQAWKEKHGDKPFSIQAVRQVGQERYDLLRYLSKQPKKPDYQWELIRLRAELTEREKAPL